MDCFLSFFYRENLVEFENNSHLSKKISSFKDMHTFSISEINFLTIAFFSNVDN